jgi:hypothetical protein
MQNEKLMPMEPANPARSWKRLDSVDLLRALRSSFAPREGARFARIAPLLLEPARSQGPQRKRDGEARAFSIRCWNSVDEVMSMFAVFALFDWFVSFGDGPNRLGSVIDNEVTGPIEKHVAA